MRKLPPLLCRNSSRNSTNSPSPLLVPRSMSSTSRLRRISWRSCLLVTLPRHSCLRRCRPLLEEAVSRWGILLGC